VKGFAIGLLIASAALAQVDRGSMNGPVLGLVFDRDAGALRPLLGVPGSSMLGAPLDGASGLRESAAASYALAIDSEGVAAVVTAAGRRPLSIAAKGATRAAVSPGGSAAALYFADSGTAQIFIGMPDAPQSLRTVTLESAPVRMALSDDGATLLATIRSGRGEVVDSYQGSQAAQVFYSARRISGLAFMPGSSAAIVAEPNAVKVVSPEFGAQAIGGQDLAEIVAVAASADRSRVFIAMRSGRIVMHELASSSETSLACACEPAVLTPLRGNAVFRLNEMDNGPLWLLDADAPQPRISFVAVPAEGSR
jgi:hypothetical protein